jgi:GT2 family glycosyltransferase
MTSSERHLRQNEKRWDYSVQCYKPHDPMCEPGLFSIIVLAHGRPDTTRRSVLSTLDCTRLYSGEIEWIFVENGGNLENRKFFDGLKLDRKVIIQHKNYGINHGLNQGWGLSRGEFVMIHENDWEATRIVDFLSIAKQIFEEKPDIGIVQLRDPFDPHENHGRGKPEYNPWSCTTEAVEKAGYKIWKEITKGGHAYLISEFPNGFNNNPVIIRKQVYRECGPYPEPPVGADPRHGETLYQERVSDLGCAIAYVGVPVYWHMGRIQTQGT